MKIEKRCGAGVPEEPETPAAGRKPVIVYIMVLFIAAFLLMALSFFMHQRSNSEALGQLQSSVSAMQEMQETQEHVVQLQKELAKANETVNELMEHKGRIEMLETELAQANQGLDNALGSMDDFWQLDEAYVLSDQERCQELLAVLEQRKELGTLMLSEKAWARLEEIGDALAALPGEDGADAEH